MRIETERLIITELTLDMAYDIHVNSLDDDNKRFVPDEVFETVDDAKEVIEYLMEQYDTLDGPLLYPILLKEDNSNIGYVQIVPLGDNKWEVGYHISKKYTNKGYATEALKSFLPEALNMLKLNKVIGVVLKENIASCHVLEKCGFKIVFEGIDEYQGENRELIEFEYTK